MGKFPMGNPGRFHFALRRGAIQRPDLERAYRAGANSFMVKPSADDLEGLAKCFTDYWFKYNLIPRVT